MSTAAPASRRHAGTPRRRRQPLHLDGELWVDAPGGRLGGGTRMALLRAVAEHGSITQAAKAVGLSYKGAWDAVEAMNQAAGVPLVAGSAGGRGGGGTLLTEHGLRLLQRYEQVAAVHRRLLRLLDEQAFDLEADLPMTQLMILKTSARNQFAGKVTAVRAGAVNDEVEITVPGGPRIVAVLTRESTDQLGLRLNMAALALVKSSSVLLAAEQQDLRLSARNQFAGTVRSLHTGAVNTELTLALDVGGAVTAVVTETGVQALGLAVGSRAVAFFNANSVIVATAA